MTSVIATAVQAETAAAAALMRSRRRITTDRSIAVPASRSSCPDLLDRLQGLVHQVGADRRAELVVDRLDRLAEGRRILDLVDLHPLGLEVGDQLLHVLAAGLAL